LKSFHGDLQLRAAVVEALDGLRHRAIPNTRTLRAMIGDTPGAGPVVDAIEAELAQAANNIKAALKDRSGRRRANVAGDGTAAARILADLDRRLSRTGAPEVTR
jgi:hypothetical protein